MTLADQLMERERQWRGFHSAYVGEDVPVRDPSAVLADLSFLLTFCSPEDLARDPDPEKVGIAKMRAALGLVSRP